MREEGIEGHLAAILLTLSDDCLNVGNPHEAESHLKDVVAMVSIDDDDPVLASSCRAKLGILYDWMGEPAKAIRLLKEAIDIEGKTWERHCETGSPYDSGLYLSYLRHLLDIYMGKRDIDMAKQVVEEALSVIRKEKTSGALSTSYNDARLLEFGARLFALCGNPAQAKKSLEQALDQLRKVREIHPLFRFS